MGARGPRRAGLALSLLLLLCACGAAAGSHYETLGVSKFASADEINKAYRKLARDTHPDKVRGDEAEKEAATARFIDISTAHDVLGDPKKRKEYDRETAADAEYARMHRGGQRRSNQGGGGARGRTSTYTYFDPRTGRTYTVHDLQPFARRPQRQPKKPKKPEGIVGLMIQIARDFQDIVLPVFTGFILLLSVWVIGMVDQYIYGYGDEGSGATDGAPQEGHGDGYGGGGDEPSEASSAAAAAAQRRWAQNGQKPTKRRPPRRGGRERRGVERYNPAMLETRGFRTLVVLVTPAAEAIAREAGEALASATRVDRVLASYDVVDASTTGRRWAAFLRRDFRVAVKEGASASEGIEAVWAVALVLMPNGRRAYLMHLSNPHSAADLAATVKDWLFDRVLAGAEPAKELRTEVVW